MRHLVLYKLAGFPTADKVPLFGELCYGKNRVFKKTFARNGQKSSFFALFWPKNAIFSHFLAPRVPPELRERPPGPERSFQTFPVDLSDREGGLRCSAAKINDYVNFGMVTS